MSTVTEILHDIEHGDAEGASRLLTLVYDELRRVASHKLANEAAGHTLQPTALVHEAWLRLGGDQQPVWKNRGHFFAAAAEAMRRILVDSARRRQQSKRGGKQDRVELAESRIIAPVPEDRILQVDEALEVLAREDPLKARIAVLRYFVGLKHQEIADAVGLNEKTVRRHWEVAKVRLYELISGQAAPPEASDPGRP